MERLIDGLLATVRLSKVPRSMLSLGFPASVIEAVVGVGGMPAAIPVVAMFATAEIKAASPPCESTIVVIQEFSGSGGNRTLVMIPGTTSEKCLETKVDIKEDLPTPSGVLIALNESKEKLSQFQIILNIHSRKIELSFHNVVGMTCMCTGSMQLR